MAVTVSVAEKSSASKDAPKEKSMVLSISVAEDVLPANLAVVLLVNGLEATKARAETGAWREAACFCWIQEVGRSSTGRLVCSCSKVAVFIDGSIERVADNVRGQPGGTSTAMLLPSLCVFCHTGRVTGEATEGVYSPTGMRRQLLTDEAGL